MAGEFHHYIRRDAVGEGEADEGLSAGVGADLSPLGIDIIMSDTVSVEGDVDGGVEFADFAEVFEAAVHLLVGHVREGLAAGEIFVFVFVENGDGVLMEDDGKAVVCLLGGYGHDAVVDVGAADLNDVGVTQAGEGAEAEEVPGAGHGGGFLDGLLILFAVHVVEFEDGAVFGDFQIVELQEFVLIQEDNGLFYNFEDGFVGLDVAHLGIAFPDGPAEEPGEVLVLLHGGVFLQIAVGTEVGDEFVQAVFVVVIQACFFVEAEEVVFEGFDHLDGFPAPFLETAFLTDEIVHVVSGGLDLGLLLFDFGLGNFLLGDFGGVLVVDGGDACLVHAHGLLEFFAEVFCSGSLSEGEFVGLHVAADGRDEGVDNAVVCAAGCDDAVPEFFFGEVPLGFFLFVGVVGLDVGHGVPDEFLDAGAADVNVAADG